MQSPLPTKSTMLLCSSKSDILPSAGTMKDVFCGTSKVSGLIPGVASSITLILLDSSSTVLMVCWRLRGRDRAHGDEGGGRGEGCGDRDDA